MGVNPIKPILCLFLLSTIVQTRPSSSVRNSPFNHSCSQIKRLKRECANFAETTRVRNKLKMVFSFLKFEV